MRKEDDGVPDERLSGQVKSTLRHWRPCDSHKASIHHHRTRRVPGSRQHTRRRSALLNAVCISLVECSFI